MGIMISATTLFSFLWATLFMAGALHWVGPLKGEGTFLKKKKEPE
jgi:hypothetical protein